MKLKRSRHGGWYFATAEQSTVVWPNGVYLEYNWKYSA